MTTTILPTTASTPVAEPRPRFADVVAAEWIKLWSLRSTYVAIAASVIAVIAFGLNAALADYHNWPQYDASLRAGFVPGGSLRDAFSQGAAMSLILAVSAIGALSVVGEYGSGHIRTTFAAVPARRTVMAAKVAVVTPVTTIIGLLTAAASFALTQAILAGRHANASLGAPGALRDLAAVTLLAPVSALVGLAIGTLIRHSATTIVATVAILLLIPASLSANHHWTADIDHAQPFNAWARLTEPNGPGEHYPWTHGGAWTVYAVWALVAIVITVLGADRRDQ